MKLSNSVKNICEAINKGLKLEKIVDYVNSLVDDGSTKGFVSYSGRGMLGKECAAFYTNDKYSHKEILKQLEKLGGVNYDNMGLGTVYYWPSVTLDQMDKEGGIVYKENNDDDDDDSIDQ